MLFSLKAQRKKVKAEAQHQEAVAESSELDNVEKAIKIWREMAESLKEELSDSRKKYDNLMTEVRELKKSICKLNTINTKILGLLDKMSPENYEKLIVEIKREIEQSKQ